MSWKGPSLKNLICKLNHSLSGIFHLFEFMVPLLALFLLTVRNTSKPQPWIGRFPVPHGYFWPSVAAVRQECLDSWRCLAEVWTKMNSLCLEPVLVPSLTCCHSPPLSVSCNTIAVTHIHIYIHTHTHTHLQTHGHTLAFRSLVEGRTLKHE